MVVVRAPHEQVVRTLRAAGVLASVGPTSGSGWTCVWLDHEDAIDPHEWGFGEYLSVEEMSSTARVRACEATGTMATLWADADTAVDATQAAEVVFSLLGEMILLGAVLPGWLSLVGIALTVLGLVLYMLAQGRQR